MRDISNGVANKLQLHKQLENMGNLIEISRENILVRRNFFCQFSHITLNSFYKNMKILTLSICLANFKFQALNYA